MYILFYFVLQLLHAFQNFHRFQRIQQITDLFIYYCNSSNETIFIENQIFFPLKSFCSLLFRFPGDSMLYHDGMFFTTYDNDNDNASGNCGSVYRGAWWYKSLPQFKSQRGVWEHKSRRRDQLGILERFLLLNERS